MGLGNLGIQKNDREEIDEYYLILIYEDLIQCVVTCDLNLMPNKAGSGPNQVSSAAV